MAVDRHRRDPGVAELIRYFDQPERAAWHLLDDKEVALLHEEIRKCSHPDTGFPYICRNYYWITTKDGSDILMRFKETQEMVWETIRYLRLRGRGVKLLIIKARQLYISSFAEALLAYETQFNPNSRGLLVSYNEDHAAKLFQMILHMYDQLPWWLRPMIGSREYKQGIHLINKDPELRRLNPGMNSSIMVQGANQNVGVAEGTTINCAHLSEFGSWEPSKARKIIISDFRWALPDAPNTTALLETRVQRASKFAERFWESQVELGDVANWHPLFIPIYFDRSHFIAPRAGWKPDQPEIDVKQRAHDEWRVCSGCGQIRPANFGGVDLSGVDCHYCKKGQYQPYVLQDGQMRWLWEQRVNAEKMGEIATTEMKQSLATNPQEAFANVTETVFSGPAKNWVAQTTRGDCLARGYMAEDGTFHAPRRIKSDDPKEWGQESAQCFSQGCKIDHRGETNRYLKIWQPPLRGRKYAMSVDPSGGLGGTRDYSVIWVNMLGEGPEPDIQVAIYRHNLISPWHLADVANFLGRWYNNALAVVDYTNHQTVGDRLLIHWKYPNVYRWYNADAINQRQNRFHWVWNFKNKESALITLDGYLRDRALITKDPIFAKEMRHYQRHSDGSLGAPDAKSTDGLGEEFDKIHDDTVTALMQLVEASHQREPRREHDRIALQHEGVAGTGEWMGICTKCEKNFSAQVPCERDRCPWCGSYMLRWKLAKPEKLSVNFQWSDMGGVPGERQDRYGRTGDLSFGEGSLLPNN